MPSLFVALYVALYPYTPQSDQELSLVEGDLLYILDTSSEDGWWKAKKRMIGAEDDEPVGLVPKNYIEPVNGKARALYDYDRQTDEEVSIKEGEILDVYDTSDPDWVLISVRDEYGFAPSNYIQFVSDAAGSAPLTPGVAPVAAIQYPDAAATTPQPQAQPAYAQQPSRTSSYDQQPPTPTSQLSSPVAAVPSAVDDRYTRYREPAAHYEEEEEDEPAPRLPSRPRAASVAHDDDAGTALPRRGSDFLNWIVQEVDSKRKKYKATLAVGNGLIIFSPERASASPQQWTITNLVVYNAEKKHVFLEFQHPTASLDLHAGTKEAAAAIISAIGDIVGAKKATGLREVIAASVPNLKYGKILYDFDAQGDDEVTVREGDDVLILEDQQSDEWWMIRHLLTGNEGVVPSSYVEVVKKPTRSSSLAQKQQQEEASSSTSETRQRHSSKKSSRSRRDSQANTSSPPPTPAKQPPDPSKVNGAKIAVDVNKMSVEDLDYVEHVTGQSLDGAKPESSRKTIGAVATKSATSSSAAAADSRPKTNSFDWFEFFLSCGVDYNNCQRYALSFDKDQMDESVLPDITPSIMRRLGLKEGDIIRVAKLVDEKYSKKKRGVSFGAASVLGDGEDEGNGESLFTGPGGALKNNTRKSRPAPAVTTSQTVDGKLLMNASSADLSQQEMPEQNGYSHNIMDSSSAGSSASVTPMQSVTPVPVAPPPPQQQAPSVPSANVAPILVPAITGHTAQEQQTYLALQPKLVFQPPVAFPMQQQSQPMQQPQPMLSLPTGMQVHLQTGYVVQQQPTQPVFYQQHRAPPPPPVTVHQTLPQQQARAPPGMTSPQSGFQAMPTGFQMGPQPTGIMFAQPLQAQPTRSFVPQSQFGIQQMQTGFGIGSSMTPLQAQPTGYGFGNGPPMSGNMEPLVPMKTGPPPKLRRIRLGFRRVKGRSRIRREKRCIVGLCW
ncbi:uncharacterized protein V1518DRAFT_78798 [Limtongia smithiae]|uniref:uncharacterized protein n=1 Tax=Limtongia smithiae TaxID=1125753 RepID=UPI0034CEE07D